MPGAQLRARATDPARAKRFRTRRIPARIESHSHRRGPSACAFPPNRRRPAPARHELSPPNATDLRARPRATAPPPRENDRLGWSRARDPAPSPAFLALRVAPALSAARPPTAGGLRVAL